jgi:hypothetical protein
VLFPICPATNLFALALEARTDVLRPDSKDPILQAFSDSRTHDLGIVSQKPACTASCHFRCPNITDTDCGGEIVKTTRVYDPVPENAMWGPRHCLETMVARTIQLADHAVGSAIRSRDIHVAEDISLITHERLPPRLCRVPSSMYLVLIARANARDRFVKEKHPSLDRPSTSKAEC